MKQVNRRNKYGVKDSYNIYRTIKGIEYEHWTSKDIDIEEEKKKYPNYKFIRRGHEIFRGKNNN